MARKGGLSAKFYRETKGVKVSGGQQVTSGTLLTRQGDKWKPGINVVGRMHLTAACDGEVYFTRKKSTFKKEATFINIRPVKQEVKK
ncbi:MAG: 50S ribosomal protein L27 [Candidatus Omnitrophica bacterium]|nr:50S ribosomal protein L27 [Candidatus Omnitrophota bacterium]